MNGSDKARAVDEDHDVEDLNSAIAVYNAADLPLRRLHQARELRDALNKAQMSKTIPQHHRNPILTDAKSTLSRLPTLNRPSRKSAPATKKLSELG